MPAAELETHDPLPGFQIFLGPQKSHCSGERAPTQSSQGPEPTLTPKEPEGHGVSIRVRGDTEKPVELHTSVSP